MESLESQIVTTARSLAEALKDFAYTRKDDDKKRVQSIQSDLIRICDAQALRPPIE